MAYRRRYRGRRRYRTLSKSRVLTRTSAKSQAFQINALNRKVNRIYRANKPELKMGIMSPQSISLSSEAFANTYKVYSINMPTNGNLNYQRIGDKILLKTLSVRLSMEYFNTSSTGYHNSESAGSALRVIVVMTKGSVDQSSTPPSLSSILDNVGTSGDGYTAMSICPLHEGITNDYKILLDRNIIMTTTRNQVIRKFAIPINVANIFSHHSSTTQSRQIYVYVIGAGLHFDTNYTEYINGVLMTKLTWTDA